MNSKRKKNLYFTDKKEQKGISHFYSQSSKPNNQNNNNNNQNKSDKKLLSNEDKKLKERIISLSNNSINKKKFNKGNININETNSKAIKKLTPKYILNKTKSNKINEISERKKTKKIENIISASPIYKNEIISEGKTINNNIINHFDNNSNIHIGPNNKITIIKNIFNRTNKPQIKESNKKIRDIEMKIIKIKHKNNHTITEKIKKLRGKKLYKGLRNNFKKKFINRQSLSTYNSIDNIKNENNCFITSKNKNSFLHCNTASNNLKISSKIKSFKNKFSISYIGNNKQFYMNLSHSNFINTYPSLNNCKSEANHKIKNIKTIKTLSINSENNYKKIYTNFKRKRVQNKINLIRSTNNINSPHIGLKNKISSTSGNHKNNLSNEKYDKYITNNKGKKTIEINKIKNNNLNINNKFYQKIKKINLKTVRSNSINVNLINTTKNKKLNSDNNNNNTNNNSSYFMNVTLSNKLIALKNKDLSENKTIKNKISTIYKNNENIKENENNNEKELNFINIIRNSDSLNNQEDINQNYSSNLRNKIKIINYYYKKKAFSNVKDKNNLSNHNTLLQKYNTNLKKNDLNKDFNKNINDINEEDQIYNNIYQNSLTMYSIYILSKYYNLDKIGLSQILIYDKNNNIIPVLYSNSNSENDSFSLFINNNKYYKFKNKPKNYKIKQNNFTCEFKQNLYINFFINNYNSNNIHYIEIINYYNNKQKVSPSKDIKIYHENILLYEGVLSIDKPNKIRLDSNMVNNEKNDSKYIEKNIFSTLSTTSRKNFSLLSSNNSNVKIKQKNIEIFNSPKSNKSIKQEKIKFYKSNNGKLRKCLLYSNKSEINNINNNINKEKNYIKFEDICIVIVSNYGHKEYVGLTGIEFIDNKGKIINIEKAKTIGALPKDLYTIYNDDKEKRFFENIFNGDNNTNDINNMWATKLIKNYNHNKTSFSYSYIELSFYDKICLSKIKIYNYNDKNNLDIGAREIKLYFDNKYYDTIILRQGIGERIFDSLTNKNKNTDNNFELDENEDFSQVINFPINKNDMDKEYIYNYLNKNKFSSLLFNQNYETPYLPCCFILKFQFNNNYIYYKNKFIFDTYQDSLDKYNAIGLNKIEIYNEKGNNLLNCTNYKIISNCETLNEDLKEKDNTNYNSKILLNGTQNENGNNCLFFVFNYPVFISYIKFFPLEIKENIYSDNTVKDFKIFCDNYIVYEGTMNNDKPSCVYFTSDLKLMKNNLIPNNNKRRIKEEKNSKYISMTFT